MLYVLFISILGIFISYLLFRDSFNPLIIFNFWWFAISILSLLNLFGIDSPSNMSVLIIINGVITFNISVISMKIFSFYIKSRSVKKIHRTRKYDVNKKILPFLYFIVILFLFISSIQVVIDLLNGLTFNEVRDGYYAIDQSSLFNKLIYYFSNYVIEPLKYLLIIVSIIEYLNDKKSYKNLIFSLIIIVLSTLYTAGRFLLINTVIIFIFSLLIFKYKYKRKFKIKLTSILFIVVLIIFILYITDSRTWIGSDLNMMNKMLRTSYLYYIGGVTYLGKLLEFNTLSNNYSYGFSWFAGIISPFFSFLTSINLINYPKLLTLIPLYTGPQLSIGHNIYFNAFSTIFFYFYLDLGFIGVILGTMLFAILACFIYFKMKNSFDLYWISLYLLILIQLNNTSTRWFFYAPGYFLSFFVMKIGFRRKRDKFVNYEE